MRIDFLGSRSLLQHRRARQLPARGGASAPVADGDQPPHAQTGGGLRPQAVRTHDARGDADACRHRFPAQGTTRRSPNWSSRSTISSSRAPSGASGLDIACLPVFAVSCRRPCSATSTGAAGCELRIHERRRRWPNRPGGRRRVRSECSADESLGPRRRGDLRVAGGARLSVGTCGREAFVGMERVRKLPLIRVGPKTAIRPMIDDALGAAWLALSWQYEVSTWRPRSSGRGRAGLRARPAVDVTLHRGRVWPWWRARAAVDLQLRSADPARHAAVAAGRRLARAF